jgi:uncharacterized protein HemY
MCLPQLDQKQFAEFEKMKARARRVAPPSDEDLSQRFRAERARMLTTLGRILLKQGEVTEAEKLLKEACADNPVIMEANTALALQLERLTQTGSPAMKSRGRKLLAH